MNKLIIWALYDDAQMCYFKALSPREDVIIYPIGINEHPEVANYHKIDLSITNLKLIQELDKLPKPDIILASPPCESWSTADSITRQMRQDFKLQGAKFYEEFNENQKLARRRRYYFNATRTRILGESTINGLIQIIKHFNPKVWIIENPANSLSWKYQEEIINFHGIMNKTYYCNWQDPSFAKPTIFKSNIDLSLKPGKAPLGEIIAWESEGNYAKRSSIPEELIHHIFRASNWYIKIEMEHGITLINK